MLSAENMDFFEMFTSDKAERLYKNEDTRYYDTETHKFYYGARRKKKEHLKIKYSELAKKVNEYRDIIRKKEDTLNIATYGRYRIIFCESKKFVDSRGEFVFILRVYNIAERQTEFEAYGYKKILKSGILNEEEEELLNGSFHFLKERSFINELFRQNDGLSEQFS